MKIAGMVEIEGDRRLPEDQEGRDSCYVSHTDFDVSIANISPTTTTPLQLSIKYPLIPQPAIPNP
jgi:hypothetical protein